jgi:hypothetical protein
LSSPGAKTVIFAVLPSPVTVTAAPTNFNLEKVLPIPTRLFSS